jgi:hypothetical protein
MGMVLIGSIAIAWIQFVFFGLPPDPSLSFSPVVAATEPSGFLMWINIRYWVNFFFLVLIIRSGLSMFFYRQTARSFHFLITFAYVSFIIVHVALVALTGLKKNMNHIILNKSNDTELTG